MRALVCHRLGDPTQPPAPGGVLSVETNYKSPHLPKDGVRIRVAAGSVNFADTLLVQGKYQEKLPIPFIPGSEVSGTVIEVGPKVSRISVGDKVCAVLLAGGAFAEEAVANQNAVFPLPPGSDEVAAAGLPVAYGTSHLALVRRAHLKPGQVLLVLGAAGGVGTAAVQIGKKVGATVIAVAQGGEKAKLLRQMGADLVVDTAQTPDLRKEVQRFLKERGAKGVDVVLDPVGGKQFKEALRVVKWGAQIVVIGFASGEVPSIPANIVMVKNVTVHGLYWGSHMQHDPKVLLDSMEELMGWFRGGSISVQVSHKLPLEEAHKAFAALMRREARGKVLVVPGSAGVQEGVKGSVAEKVEAPVLGWAGGGSMTSKL